MTCLARGSLEAKQYGGSFIAGVCFKGYPKENSAGGVGAQQDEVCEGTVSPFNDSAAF